ncbi:hopanoid-associated sugar epimerase [Desulfatirhabdium butyrativorans]|uniref:hopanoid-associated sugar epimerase n=1 Tax=Desulfatirhabdium butyrativorans TaxID=340467 RepID=UPI00040DDEDB|nr:hopanoid-associated sugar epimerase [Desulfatirhabdium butyrativorans]
MNLVTGASGFIGGRIVHALAERGEDIRVLVRPGADLRGIEGLKVERCTGDVLDRTSIRAAVRGCRRIYHAAACYTFWSRNPEQIYAVNVEGTRNVIREGIAAGVERIVHTSSVATIGIPRHGVGTEQTPVCLEDMVGHYKRSKFLAEKAALALVREGAPVVIVNPTYPVGEGDVKPTPSGDLIVRFLQRKMPAYLDTGLNVVDVDDVAKAHLLAGDRGKIGERYILGNRNMTLKEILQVLASITGLPQVRFRMPYYPILLFAKMDTALARLIPGRSPLVACESVQLARKKMFVDPAKAIAELGMPQGSPGAALEKAVRWFRSNGYA